MLASISKDGPVKIWDIKNKPRARTIYKSAGELIDASWSPNGSHLAISSIDFGVKTFDATNWNLTGAIALRSKSVTWRPDEEKLLSLTHTGVIWELLAGHANTVSSISRSGNGLFLASSSTDKTVKNLENAQRASLKELNEPPLLHNRYLLESGSSLSI